MAFAATDEFVITVTPEAHSWVVALRDEEPEGKELGIRLEILSDTGVDFTYDLSFQVTTKADLSDSVRNHDGLRVIIPAKDVVNVSGATLDLEDGGLVLRNPNKPKPFTMDGMITDGELADQIRSLLTAEINPALAAHGGFVTFVGLDDDNAAYLSMGGGCQGCSMSRMTMIDGVQTQLKAELPSLTKVVDVTDHTAGANPYYS